MPFGETSVSQKVSWWSTPYQFTGKEKDDETGYNYFGARYYNSDLSIWLSVDPMSDERAWLSPYNYCQWRPLIRVDVDGLLDDHWAVCVITGDRIYISDDGGDQIQFITSVRPLEDGGMEYLGTESFEGPRDFYVGPVRGGYMASYRDLWMDLDIDNYNRNSYDFGTGGLYEYSHYDLRKRYELLNDPKLSSFAGVVLSWEAAGVAQPVHSLEYSRQLTYRYGTNSSFNAAYDLGYLELILDAAFFPSPVRRVRTPRPTVPITRTPGINNPSISKNTWNQFLKETKGTYKGKDWISKASNDYKLWKAAR
jgi:RHS repeat-associated protein